MRRGIFENRYKQWESVALGCTIKNNWAEPTAKPSPLRSLVIVSSPPKKSLISNPEEISGLKCLDHLPAFKGDETEGDWLTRLRVEVIALGEK